MSKYYENQPKTEPQKPQRQPIVNTNGTKRKNFK